METKNVWRERLDAVLADPEARDLAAAVYYLVASHLAKCDHKRRCPEDSLMTEAQLVVGHANKKGG
jgi:hypothetical protein